MMTNMTAHRAVRTSPNQGNEELLQTEAGEDAIQSPALGS